MNHTMSRCRSGFTLVEIMLVVIIIGMIAAIGLPKLIGLRSQAGEGMAKAYITNLETAIGLYEMNLGVPPPTLEDLITNTSGSSKWRGPYMKDKIIKRDPWDQPYSYTVREGEYEITSAGPPGKNLPISSND